jgi:hypothetical protein
LCAGSLPPHSCSPDLVAQVQAGPTATFQQVFQLNNFFRSPELLLNYLGGYFFFSLLAKKYGNLEKEKEEV